MTYRARTSAGFNIACSVLIGITLVGCATVNTANPDELADGTRFDILSNARCSHLANVFQPDRVIQVGARAAGLFRAEYFRSESYVRIVEPHLLTTNQVILQACIQLELGEIPPEQYTELVRENSARYLALLPNGRPAEQAAAITSAVNSGLKQMGSEERLNAVEVERAALALLSNYEVLGAEPNEAAIARVAQRIASQVAAEAVADASKLVATESQTSLLAQYAVMKMPSLTATDVQDGELQGYRPAFAPREALVVEYILFDLDSAEISDLDSEKLRSFLANDCCRKNYTVYGFADVTGTSPHNLMLSRLRAAAVARLIAASDPTASVREIAVGEVDLFGTRLRDNRVVYVFSTRKAP